MLRGFTLGDFPWYLLGGAHEGQHFTLLSPGFSFCKSKLKAFLVALPGREEAPAGSGC